MDINLLLFLIFIGSPISIFIHEFGHALAAIAIRANDITITIGSGREFYVVKWKRYIVKCNIFYFIGGASNYERDEPFTSKEMIWLTLLGPVFNGIAAGVIYFLLMIFPNVYLEIFFWFNMWLAIANLIPFRINEKQTDGYAIIQLLKNKQ
ncbi:site-2 protease family protein [Oceanobacillus sp. FSL H7-0719]|uniref:site-2 protease family protein n=1 Tax=Oceanobacillus sp. FSL H7-0719 TaxID=2954507 RepID=UPI0032452235